MTVAHPIVLVAIDFSAGSHAALAWAHAFVRGTPRVLHLIHVVEELSRLGPTRERAEADTRLLLEDARAELKKIAPLDGLEPPFVAHVRRGHPVREILTCARDLGAELLVTGCHGHAGLERLLVGSVAERLVRLASCPVVVVKA